MTTASDERVSARSVVLVCHPQTPTDAVRSLSARVRRTSNGTLVLAFTLEADLDRIRIPPPRPPAFTIGLWQHTCFEAFVGTTAAPAYHEVNVSPSGEWAVFAFHGYRDVAPVPDDVPAPEISVGRAAHRLAVDVTLHLHSLAAPLALEPLRLAVSAVVEETSGRMSCWAARHPAGQPDFHHAEAFALALDAPAVDSGSVPG
jgi:hypothetical protein